jgi:signal transduction histidine kinase/CheY-like chemotaxis protein
MSANLSLELHRVHAAVSRWMIQDTRQGFFATDAQFRIVVWNRWMEIHSEYSAAEVHGRNVFELYPEAVSRGIQEYYANALAGHVTVISHGLHRHLLALAPTNENLSFAQMPQSGQIGPLLDDGVVVGTATLLEDVSDRLASEGELRRQLEAQRLARATAEKALRAKDEFLSTLSHEIRTPLNAVLGWARILLARPDVERDVLDRALHVIERNAAMQAKMIDDMLDIARIVAGKLRLEMQPLDPANVVLAAIDVVMPAANARRIAVQTRLDPNTPRVLGDQDRLQQVVWNLLSNAVKFTEEGGAIDVRLETSGRLARIVIADTGQGITPEFLPYVFERFRQDDASSARRHGGLGLGLALVRELVELHGGTVKAASEGHNRGATFTIELPTMLSAEVRRNHLDVSALDLTAAPSLAGVRVLLVEDERDARDVAVAALAYRGALVTPVSSTADGIAVLLSATPETLPHVLVSDIGMPKADGYDFIHQVRALDPARGGRLPAVAVTGYANPEDVERAIAAGFQVHVSKPIDPSVLVSAVARLITPEA